MDLRTTPKKWAKEGLLTEENRGIGCETKYLKSGDT